MTYAPRTTEIPVVAEAIRILREVETDQAPDPRWNVGYAEGVAMAMAVMDFWCQEAADPELWRTVARTHDARPADGDRAAFRRKRAWFDYFRAAAAS